MSLRKIIRSVINENFGLSYSLYENVQLADKLYFNTDKLSQEDKDIILGITGGDNYTKIISDFYYYLKIQNKMPIELPKVKSQIERVNPKRLIIYSKPKTGKTMLLKDWI